MQTLQTVAGTIIGNVISILLIVAVVCVPDWIKRDKKDAGILSPDDYRELKRKERKDG